MRQIISLVPFEFALAMYVCAHPAMAQNQDPSSVQHSDETGNSELLADLDSEPTEAHLTFDDDSSVYEYEPGEKAKPSSPFAVYTNTDGQVVVRTALENGRYVYRIFSAEHARKRVRRVVKQKAQPKLGPVSQDTTQRINSAAAQVITNTRSDSTPSTLELKPEPPLKVSPTLIKGNLALIGEVDPPLTTATPLEPIAPPAVALIKTKKAPKTPRKVAVSNVTSKRKTAVRPGADDAKPNRVVNKAEQQRSAVNKEEPKLNNSLPSPAPQWWELVDWPVLLFQTALPVIPGIMLYKKIRRRRYRERYYKPLPQATELPPPTPTPAVKSFTSEFLAARERIKTVFAHRDLSRDEKRLSVSHDQDRDMLLHDHNPGKHDQERKTALMNTVAQILELDELNGIPTQTVVSGWKQLYVEDRAKAKVMTSIAIMVPWDISPTKLQQLLLERYERWQKRHAAVVNQPHNSGATELTFWITQLLRQLVRHDITIKGSVGGLIEQGDAAKLDQRDYELVVGLFTILYQLPDDLATGVEIMVTNLDRTVHKHGQAWLKPGMPLNKAKAEIYRAAREAQNSRDYWWIRRALAKIPA